MADTALQRELQAQLDYAAIRNTAYSQYGKKLPKTRHAYARRLQNKIRRSAKAAARPRLRYNADGTGAVYAPVPALATTAANFATMDGIVGRGAYRRKRRYGGRGVYYANQVSGRGNYWKKLRQGTVAATKWARKHQKALHTVASAGAQFIPGGTQALAGVDRVLASGVGTAAGNLIEGRGAYGPLFPDLTNVKLTEYDSVQSLEYGNLIVTGREKISDIFGNDHSDPDNDNSDPIPFTTFYVQVTPGNFEQFPKLAQHAANFKEYEWVQCVFTYKSTLPANYQTDDVNTGSVILAPEYNMTNPVWTTQGDLTDQDDKVEGGIMGTITKGMECDPDLLTSKGLKKVRTRGLTPTELSAGQEKYDLGRMSFGMFGSSKNLAGKMIGELWVTYKVHFKSHRQYTGLGFNIPQSIFYNNWSSGALTWPANGSSNPEDIWKTIFDYTQTGISRELCYNNLEFEIKSETYNQSISTQRLDGVRLTLTFPSSLKGNYEIEISLFGMNLLFSDEVTNPDETNEPGGFTQSDANMRPSTTGTCKLNYDITSLNGQAQSCQTNSLAARQYVIRAHIHLEQATSLADNSFSIDVPLVKQVGSVHQEMSSWNGNGGTEGQFYTSSMIKMTQYNNFQRKGAIGLPYKDPVTKTEVIV